MAYTFSKDQRSHLAAADRRRRKREMILIIVILVAVALITLAESRLIRFGDAFPVSNTILMFTLININLLLLILLLFLVLRNIVKLLYDRRRKILGARLRTRLVLAFISLTLLPTTILFFFAINFITSSIEFWFNVPVEQALEKSLQVGRRIYEFAEENNRFFLERVAYQIEKKKLLDPKRKEALTHYIQVVQREFNLTSVEVYSQNQRRVTFSTSQVLENQVFRAIAADSLQRIQAQRPVWTVSETTPRGELVRTTAAVPFGVAPAEAVAYVALGTFLPADLSRSMKQISSGFEEYQQSKLLKRPVRITYYIILSIVALLVVFCAVWFGFYMAKTISIPIQELGEGTRRVAEGDLGFTIDVVADDEIGSLVDSFNKMTQDLRKGREQLELSATMLRDRNEEIDTRRRYMEIVLKNVSTGVVTLDASGVITTVNTSAEKMLNLKTGEILNRRYDEILDGRLLTVTAEAAERLTKVPKDTLETALRLTVDGRPKSFLISVNALKDEADNYMGMVMVLDDLTELEKAQRMAAWREVARRIAHEVKNPLTPISLSAQRLKRKYAERIGEAVFLECTQMIIDQVDLIRILVNEFSAFARFPAANPKPCDLGLIIKETMALYEDGHPGVFFTLNLSPDIPPMNLDRQQIKQAMLNLVDNAIAALKQSGNIVITAFFDPVMEIARIEVADDGPGISDEDKTRLFEPNFSTKKAGMGLGLTIVSTIVADHHGLVRVQDNEPKGARFIIELPA